MTHNDLRRLRQSVGLTQQALADLVGTDMKYYQRLETPPDRKSHKPIAKGMAARLKIILDNTVKNTV